VSHISVIKTRLKDERLILKALDDLGYAYDLGGGDVRGFGAHAVKVDILIRGKTILREIGLRKSGENYDLVGDWWGNSKLTRKAFENALAQRYAYHAARDQMEAQGFDLVEETSDHDGRIHLVLRRMV
jgi:hypothetical protein